MLKWILQKYKDSSQITNNSYLPTIWKTRKNAQISGDIQCTQQSHENIENQVEQ